MDDSKLQTASTYINNLLLARGLLRNGTAIKFAQLASTADQNSTKAERKQSRNSSTAAAEIINLVHDLILRRDRDQDHQESLAFTLRALRTDSSRTTSEIERLKERNQDLSRQLALQQSSARAAQTAANTAESAARALREETARLKIVLSQVRTQCANDVRKRDVQIQKLKAHLAARQRGNKTGLVGASISITPGNTGRANGASGNSEDGAPSLEDAEYSLRQETTEFLTQLSQSLSDENDSLIGLVRSTLGTLKELQGMPHNQPGLQSDSRTRSSHSLSSTEASEDLVQSVAVSYQILAADLEGVLGSLTDLLTNPSFAPVEEVHIRDDEIHRLRDGWEKMEGRWTEAVLMMQGWQKRMLSGGDTVNLDELKMGLVLGEGLDSPSRKPVTAAAITRDDGSQGEDHEVDEDEAEWLPEDEPAPAVDDLPGFDDDQVEQQEEAPLFPAGEDDTIEAANEPLPPSPPPRHLKERNNNVSTLASASPRKVSFAPDHTSQENVDPPKATRQSYVEPVEDSSPLPIKPTLSNPAPTASTTSTSTSPQKHAATTRPSTNDNTTTTRPSAPRIPKPPPSSFQRPTTTTSASAKSTKTTTRRVSPLAKPAQPAQPALTVEEKLRLAEREARRLQSASPSDRAPGSQRRRHKPAREQVADSKSEPATAPEKGVDGKHVDECADNADAPRDDNAAEPEDVASVVAKVEDTKPKRGEIATRKRDRTKIAVGGRPRRRKSTLSPEELQELMGAF